MRAKDEFFPPQPAALEPPKSISNWRELGATGHRMGAPGARVTIVEFADFQCPYCKIAEATLVELRRKHPLEVAVVYRHYPMHTAAFPAAVATECAAQVGRFEALHELLYARSDSIGKESWLRFATDAGVTDTNRFSHCMMLGSSSVAVVQDTLAAHKLAIRGTPTFIINDLMYTGFGGADQFTGYVERALASTKDR